MTLDQHIRLRRVSGRRAFLRSSLSVGLALGLGGPAVSATVEVRVLGLRSSGGDLRVAICREDEFLAERCALGAVAPAAAGSVVIEDVPPGRYAAQVHHDENRNGRLDRTALGAPAEGLGFSRDAPMRFAPPRYGDAAFEAPPEGATVSLTVRYF